MSETYAEKVAAIKKGTPLLDEAQVPDDEPWPEPLETAAFHGMAGEFVRMTERDSESDPAALLLQFLAAFGHLVGPNPYYDVEAAKHRCNLFAVIVGESSKSRKGTSLNRVLAPFNLIDRWNPPVSGLSSGEGLKYHVRDAREEITKNKLGENVIEVVDVGVEDKRLLVIESEFSNVLRQADRAGNTLSATVREAWDSGNLRTLTKHDPVVATGGHISIIGHITAAELRSELTATDTANGFANRFLFIASKRSKLLPFGGAFTDAAEIKALSDRLRERGEDGAKLNRVAMTPAARERWASCYPELSKGGDGLHGSVTARAEAQSVRLALIYCLLDGRSEIDVPHLEAALAVWRYADRTALHIFGGSIGDRRADEIMRRLKAAGIAGMTRTDISSIFGRNVSADKLGVALERLRKKGLATVTMEQGPDGGRSAEVWRKTGHGTK